MEEIVMEIPMIPIVILAVGLGLSALAFWIWILVDCIQNEINEGNDRLVWVIVIIATKLLGAIVYYFPRRSKRLRLASS
jgi:hypothetical protein